MGDLALALGALALGAPAGMALALAFAQALGIRLKEAHLAGAVSATLGAVLLATLALDALLLAGLAPATATLARWVSVPGHAVDVRVVFDGPAATLMTLTALLTGLVSVFSASYLHKDPGFARFYLLLALFTSGMMAVGAAASLDLLYVGWEVVGLASTLLIAYFHTREAPVRNALVAFAVYRVGDVALLAAAVLAHGQAPSGLGLACLLIVACMAKSAAFPFTGWLARAMEGPTPSSAIFYGALSIHAGPFLLIRCWPTLEGEPLARVLLGVVGAFTALHATLVGRVQSDVKSALGYASVTQVGLILVLIAAGLPQLALVHLVGHALLRTWQLLRAPSALADALARPGPPRRPRRSQLAGLAWGIAVERGFLDHLGLRVSGWFLAPFRALDRVDRRLSAWIAGPEQPR